MKSFRTEAPGSLSACCSSICCLLRRNHRTGRIRASAAQARDSPRPGPRSPPGTRLGSHAAYDIRV